MPVRPETRDQLWLLPPSLNDLLPDDHPARFVAAFVAALPPATWDRLGAPLSGEAQGAPAYHPRVLLSVWLYGFMTGVRSCRKLEALCRDQVPGLWLTGGQRPDHNTLWRFYQGARAQMQELLQQTVGTAVRVGLVDLALQAVDGTKIAGNAAKERTYDAAGLARLRTRVAAAIADLEAQNAGGAEPPPPRLPAALTRAETLQAQVERALALVQAEAPERVNLTDPEARLQKTRHGYVAGYNAQAMVSPLVATVAGRTGRLITAAEVIPDPDDHGALVPLLAQAEERTGQAAALTLADGGYHSGPNLAACAERAQRIVMPEAQGPALTAPYHKEAFAYDPATDTFTCPQGQPLPYRSTKRRLGRPEVRVYRAGGATCRACAAFGTCTREGRQGRALEVRAEEQHLRAHRAWMATAEAQAAYRQRKELPEPVFGVLKEQQGARRFLLRGLANVAAEWTLLVTAFNLRTLWRVWRGWSSGARTQLAGTLAA